MYMYIAHLHAAGDLGGVGVAPGAVVGHRLPAPLLRRPPLLLQLLLRAEARVRVALRSHKHTMINISI